MIITLKWRLPLLFLFTLVFFNKQSLAQVYQGADAESYLMGSDMVRINERTGKIQYARLKESFIIKEEQMIQYFEKVYQLKSPYSLKLIKTEHDEIGFEHFRFQQLYQGIPIAGGTLIAHIKNERLHAFNGEIFALNNVGSEVKLDVESGLKMALETIDAKLYKWEVPEEEAFIKSVKEDEKATWKPKGELIFCPKDLNYDSLIFYLCYKYTIHANEPLVGENIYISALNGQVIARENMIHTTNVNGVASTKYSGTQAISTDSTAPGSYRLRETVRGNGVTTLNMKTGTSYGAAVDFTDADNSWNNVNANKDEVATDCHWGAGKTYDFYKSRFNRNSYDNNNARINSYVHYSSNYDNAFWNGVCMTYGDGSAFKPLTSIDVCGHEITHAVTTNSANLIYSYESGALNESFSDIFGNAIERYAKPANYSWKIGEEITYSGNGLRNMLNPKLNNHPRCYKSTFWNFGASDNGGVHTNSGVQNWWFYLITEGGSGTNDLSNVYKVDSIGILKAEQIAYRNLTVYLTSSSKYADARFYSIIAASDLYGACSKEVIAVTNAWYACNVGAKYDSGYVKAAFIADTIVCNTSKLVKFTNKSSNVSSSKWYFGDGATSTLYSPTHTYSNYGGYNVKLVVSSCFKNIKDSLTKSTYVKIDSTFNICNAVLMPKTGLDSTNKCQSFIYDEGGEDNYKEQKITSLRISAPGADSIRIKFYDFDFELNYDSLYIYKGKYPGGVKIGGFTGNTLPFSGNTFTVTGSVVTLRQISDQLVVGRGFKMYYTAFKKAVAITAYVDTTICLGNSTLLYATGKGGYLKDYFFQWKNLVKDDSVIVSPVSTTTYKAYLTDICTKSKDSAQVTVAVRNPLKIKVNADTTICSGQSVQLTASAAGGKSSTYQYGWNNGLGNSATHTVWPLTTTIYRVILSDGCTPKKDTAYVTVKVKSPLSVSLNSSDTDICYNKICALNAKGSGGDSNYIYTWNNGLDTGTNQQITLTDSTWIKVTLTDGCSALPAVDSLLIKVSEKLTVKLNNDSTICMGSNMLLDAVSSGGRTLNYTYQWSSGLPAVKVNTVNPSVATRYFVTLKDNCSDDAIDSVTVSLLPPLNVTGKKDTSICIGQSAPLEAIASGGRSGSYTYTWNNGLSGAVSHLVSPVTTTIYSVVLSDACTVLSDTATIVVTVNQPLMVKLNTADSLICFNQSASLAAIGSGGNGNYTYQWNNGLGTGSSKSISLAADTWVKVTLTDGCTVKPSSDSVLVKVRAPLTVSLNSDSTICKGTFMGLTALTSGGDVAKYSYQWSHGLPSLANQNVNPSVKTKYYLTLKDNCSTDAKDSVTIDVLPELKITGLKDTTICFGGSAFFNPTGSGGKSTQYNFQWNQGLGTNPKQTVSPKMNTTYRLTLKDQCTSPYDSVAFTVFVRPALDISAMLSKNEICMGDSARLSFNMKGGLSSQYEWYLDGLRTYDLNLFLKPAVSKQYFMELSDNCSETDTGSFVINVNALPLVAFDADKDSICRNEAVQFTNSTTGAQDYLWTFSSKDKLTDVSPLFVYKFTGDFDVNLTATSSSGCQATLVKKNYISVVELPNSNFTFSPEDADILNPVISFNNLSSDYSTFEWDFGDQMTDNVNLNPVHSYEDSGSYNIRLTTKNSLGCSDVMEKPLRINDIFTLYIPDAISVNNDGINDELVISGRGIVSYDLTIYNRWGALIFSTDQNGKRFTGLDDKGEMLIKGTYLLMLKVKTVEGKYVYVKQNLEVL